MGQEICDPEGVEGDIPRLPGLGLLPITTTMKKEKVTRQTQFYFHHDDTLCNGYEIHMGDTHPVEGANNQPLNTTLDGETDGYYMNEHCMGTYIHGILDNATVINHLLAPYAEKTKEKVFNYQSFKEEQYDKLAEHVRKHINLPLLYEILQKK